MSRCFYDETLEHSSCGVGFITRKSGEQSHETMLLAHNALCEIPHRGGMSAEGIGDGAGVNVDLSVNFYRHITGIQTLEAGEYGVANFFFPEGEQAEQDCKALINKYLESRNIEVNLWRDAGVNEKALNEASRAAQPQIRQVVFLRPKNVDSWEEFESLVSAALLEIEEHAFNEEQYKGLYPLSMSTKTQVYKSRLNSWEVIPYFTDLSHPEHWISTLFFHTRFSTNTAPNPMFAQPFRRMAHNGELNTDRKNRLSEDAIARQKGGKVVFPPGQSDSARLDQTLDRRIREDNMDIDVALLAMMPPAWENDPHFSQEVRDMLDYFSLYEEKNDGPAAVIFYDGNKVGARLDRLGLRPLRTEETHDYLTVASEAGQFAFPPEDVVRRGRIEAGGMIMYNHEKQELLYTHEILERMAAEKNYGELLKEARIKLDDLPEEKLESFKHNSDIKVSAQHVGYSMNQESFKFFLDPMIQKGAEQIFAMGYGRAPNALAEDEGGMSRFFSQRFAQVTNPPLDSIREADGMTLRVSLGAKPYFCETEFKQITLDSPILQPHQLMQIEKAGEAGKLSVARVNTLFTPDFDNEEVNQNNIKQAVEKVCDQVEALAKELTGIVILSDQDLSVEDAALPATLTISAVNQRLIKSGLRFNSTIVYLTGQAVSTHDVAVLLGFGASAVCPLTVFNRACEYSDSYDKVQNALNMYQKAVEKALMKTMGKFGLCTAESYIGGEFFEGNFIDTEDDYLKEIFPNINSPLGGAGFAEIARSAANWHKSMLETHEEKEIPLLGLFKERAEGAGHTFGNVSVRGYGEMTHEPIVFEGAETEAERTDFLPEDEAYKNMSYQKRTPEQIDNHQMTDAYKTFLEMMYAERADRPATIRDVLQVPVSLVECESQAEFVKALGSFNLLSNGRFAIQGFEKTRLESGTFQLALDNASAKRAEALADAIKEVFGSDISAVESDAVSVRVTAVSLAETFFENVITTPAPLSLDKIQPAHEITRCFASGAMSHGALVAKAHEAAAMGTNMVGAMSNSGEGGENSKRYNTIKASRIKQFASGRFGIWTGYLADPNLEEIEIKLAQGAKPGEGGQLPAHKVNVEIAAARGGTPGVELVSPPPHHDTYSIEDLGQLIHDAKAARVRVIVKLVSSEGIGTIAVGVAKAGADVINVAGNTGGTGAAQVTSIKNTGRAAEIGIAEVHQALAENGLRDKVILRCSNAHQTGMDVIKSAMMGGDSFEFGTTALMMLKCVMAKNCHQKCPAGLTTNPEVYAGDPRALAQYYMNMAQEIRDILASMGYSSLREIRGRADLLHLTNHKAVAGRLYMQGMLRHVPEITVAKPTYLEANFDPDDKFIEEFKKQFWAVNENHHITIKGGELTNRNKTTGGQFSVDVERFLNYELSEELAAGHPAVTTLNKGRRTMMKGSVSVYTTHSAGQSYGAFNNTGISMIHEGTCNDGVGKAQSGGIIIVRSPGGGCTTELGNVLVGNFALFGATGGKLYVAGQAGDRFGVRNSGAVAVVEGVGDFCCEYMTNGSIVNLGVYGKGFGNGMSGGTAYQYDPSGAIVDQCSKDSVQTISMADTSDELILGQRQALLVHLKNHAAETNSKRAQAILDNWEEELKNFYVVMPKALFNFHTAERIIELNDHKKMVEELSLYMSESGLKTLKAAYEDNKPLFKGTLPSFNECDSELICDYVNKTVILHRAMEQAQKARPDNADAYAKYLITTLDSKLMDHVAKDTREVIKDLDNEVLATLLAAKRIEDYKTSLKLREVYDTQAFGTTVWIMYCDSVNRSALQDEETLNRKLAQHYMGVLNEFIAKEAA